MHAGNNYIIKRIGRSAIPGMERLFRQVYKRPLPTGYYEKKLITGFSQLDYPGFIACSHQDEAVASLCMVPCYIMQGGTKIKAAQLTDGMTGPHHRGKGLFGQLNSAIIALANESGIQLLFGFPNQDAFPVLLKNGWEQKEQLDRFEIPVKRSARWYLNRLTGMKRTIQSDQAGDIHSVLGDGFDGIDRSRDYINYKLSLGDYALIESASGKAWVKTGHELAIGDMETNDEGFDNLMNLVYREAVQNAAGKIHFQCSRGTGLHHLFGKRYRAIPSFPVVIKKINQDLNTDRIKFTYADIDIF